MRIVEGMQARGMILATAALAVGALALSAPAAWAQGGSDPQLGPEYDGLRSETATCPNSFQVEGTKLCTHGPDPRPDRLGPTPESVGSTLPRAAENCVTNGTEGTRVQVIYAAPAGVTNRYSSVREDIREYAAAADSIYYESAKATGETRRIRFVTDTSCNISVANVTFNSSDDDDSFSKEIQELQRQGYNSNTRLYMVFLDKNVPGCGIGNILDDSQPGPANAHNLGRRYGRTDLPCWGGQVAAHELQHNIGGVQLDAPHSTGWDGNNGYHCWDEYDRMCYDDSSTYFDGGGDLAFLCSDEALDMRFDCRDDDYYSTGAPTGYLANHWNTVNSKFLHNNGFSSSNGDFNGDGMDDIAYFTRSVSGDVYVALSNGAGFDAPTQWHGAFSYGSELPLVGDFNGDGRDDVATFTRGRSGDVYVALSNGSAFVGTAVRWHNAFAYNDEIPAVGDVTCDGRDDIITFNRGGFGDVYVAKSTGSSFTGTADLWHGAFAYGNDIPVVGNFNGAAGCDDIAVFRRGYLDASNRGDVSVALSNGSSGFGSLTKWHEFFGINFELVAGGDFNGDGRDDIAAFKRGAYGDVFVATSTGSAFSGTGNVWHNAFAYNRDIPGIGNFNGGSRDDILMFQPGLSSWAAYVALSGGSAFGPRGLWRSGFAPLVTLPMPATHY